MIRHRPMLAVALAAAGLSASASAGVRENVRVFQLEPERVSKRYARIEDPAALDGLAGLCPKGAAKATVWSATRYGERPGRYRATLRMKVSEPVAAGTPLFTLSLYELPQTRRRHASPALVMPADAKPGVYFDTSVEFDRWEGFPLVYKLVRQHQGADLTIDRLTATLVRRFTDKELLAKDPCPPKPKGLAIRRDGTIDVHVVRGPYFEAQHMPEALKGCRVTTSVYEFMYQPFPLDNYPDTWEQLYTKDVIVWFNADAYAVDAARRHMLAEFVKDGGALFVFGGRLALAQGDMAGTALETVAPTPKPEPSLMLKPVGKGWVAVWNGSCYGKTAKPYWRRPRWPKEMAAVIQRLAKGGAQ